MTKRHIYLLSSLLITIVFVLVVSLAMWGQSPAPTIMPTLAQLEEPGVAIDNMLALEIGDEFVIQIDASAPSEALQTIATELDATLLQTMPDINVAVAVKSGAITPEQIQQLTSNVIIEPNYLVRSLLT